MVEVEWLVSGFRSRLEFVVQVEPRVTLYTVTRTCPRTRYRTGDRGRARASRQLQARVKRAYVIRTLAPYLCLRRILL